MRQEKGFSIVELMVVAAMFVVVFTAGSMLFAAGHSIWSMTEAKIRMQENLRQILHRIHLELQESGKDKNNVLQVTILNNTGVNNTDILRFAIPLCPCGTSTVDSNGDIKYWGAPLLWGQVGCSSTYTLDQNNKVKICHLPPGNPNNKQTLNVSENAVKAHLAHGDWIGDCNACSPATFNRYVEYRMNASGQLLRRVLDVNLALVDEKVFADSVTDFQASLNGGQNTVSLTLQLKKTAALQRQVTTSGGLDVKLRNEN